MRSRILTFRLHMIFAWLPIAIKLVIIAFVVISLLLILVVMMQRPKQEGLGAAFGSGMTDAAWGARTTDVLQRGTVYLGTLFFVFALLLSVLMGKQNAQEGKRVEAVEDSSTEEVQAEETPAEEEKPVDEIADFETQLEEVKKAAKEVTEEPSSEAPAADATPDIAPADEAEGAVTPE